MSECVSWKRKRIGRRGKEIKGKIFKSKRSTKYSSEPRDSQGEKATMNAMPDTRSMLVCQEELIFSKSPLF